MIASLRGTLVEKQAGGCVVECAGVGYLVSVSSYTLAGLPDRGAPVFLRTRQVVREDAHLLFGFTETAELELFDLMIGVSGVGPKLALAVLSGLKPAALARAIRDEQIGALVAISGVGRKTAERLIVELRDRLSIPVLERAGVSGGGQSSAVADVREALTGLGYGTDEVRDVLRDLSGDADAPSLLREALKSLGARRA